MRETLKKSKNKILFGVCGGFAEWLKADVTAIRILTIITTFFTGIGLIAYISGAFLMPNEEENNK
jgi:phage shock protein PspC (stress-responsive transcriptional regulator)